MAEAVVARKVRELVDPAPALHAAERQGMRSACALVGGTADPVVRGIVESLRRASTMHHRELPFREDLHVTRDVPGRLPGRIDPDQAFERESVEPAHRAAEWAPSDALARIFEYLLTDESTHETLPTRPERLKSAVHLYA